MAVYWLNETNWQWVLIPDSVFLDGKMVFQVDHLTTFAIFAVEDTSSEIPKSPPPNLPLPLDKKPVKQNKIAVVERILEKLEIKKEEKAGTVVPRPTLLAKSDNPDNIIKENKNLKWIIPAFAIFFIIFFVFLRNRSKKNS